jgi:MFS family permease
MKEGSSLLQEAAAGWRYVHRRAGLSGLLLIDVFNSFLLAIANVLITPLLLSFSNPALVGVQFAISSAGMLLGGLAIAAYGRTNKRIEGVLLCTFLAGIGVAVHGLRPSFALVAGAGFFLFVTFPVAAALKNALWQTKVPAHLQGRVFSIQQVATNAATPIGYCLAGPLSEFVFEPLLEKGGWLAGSVGRVIGVGPGRGIGLMFVLLGLLMMVAAMTAYRVPAIRQIDELPDRVGGGEPSSVPGSTGTLDSV